MIEKLIKAVVRDVKDFPKPGIIFKDITPIMQDPQLCGSIIDALVNQIVPLNIDVIVGIESRGFFFGPSMAQRLDVPFVPIRKAGKLPYNCIQESYALEYGEATIEMHEDAFSAGMKVLIHDDLLATGGTVLAAGKLVEQLDGIIAGYSFLISLDFLDGRSKLAQKGDPIFALASY